MYALCEVDIDSSIHGLILEVFFYFGLKLKGLYLNLLCLLIEKTNKNLKTKKTALALVGMMCFDF